MRSGWSLGAEEIVGLVIVGRDVGPKGASETCAVLLDRDRRLPHEAARVQFTRVRFEDSAAAREL